MNHPIPPRSPFATPLSGSARTAEVRIRSIFQWKKIRPPVWLMVFVGAMILLCGSLVSCQTAAPTPSVELALQHYDLLGNRVEVPTLVLSQGAETDGMQAINTDLAALEEEYRAAIASLKDGEGEDGFFRCLCYPSLEGDYLSLVLYRDTLAAVEERVGSAPVVSTWVYQVKEGRLLSQEEGLTLAGVTLDELRGQLEEALAADREEAWTLTQLSLAGFRVGADKQVTLYLSAQMDLDTYGSIGRLYQWQEGALTRYLPPSNSPEAAAPPLVPEEETLKLSPALWCGWFYASGEPEDGWNSVPITGQLRNVMLVQRTLDYYEPYYNTTETLLFSASSGPRTLMLVESSGGPHPAGLDNLVLGVWDEEEQNFVGESYLIGGDDGLYSTWEGEGALWLLCSNSVTYQGDETSTGLRLFRFAGGELEPVLELPQAALDSGVLPDTEQARALLQPMYGTQQSDLSYDFWLTHLARPGQGGFELYEKNPAYDPYHPSSSLTQWNRVGFVPLF